MNYARRAARLVTLLSSSAALPAISSPADIADLWAWFDPSDISSLYQDSGRTTPVTTNGEPVGSWSDKSGNARHANQVGAATTRPTYQTAIQNGLAACLYDGGDYLDIAASPSTSAVTMIAVARTSATVGAARGMVTTRSSTGAGVRFTQTAGNSLQTGIYDGVTFTTQTDAATTGANTTFLGGGRWTTGSANDRIFNGTITATTHALTMAHQATTSLGRINTNATTTLWNGHFAEVIIYNRALTDGEWAQVAAYLNTKWAVY